MLSTLSQLIKLWEDEAIFAKTFCELLQSYLRPKLEHAYAKISTQNFEVQAQERLM